MTITQLEYIIALSKYGNFAQAAKQSFVTQPTLSIQVQKLEEFLGIIIFDRSKKPLKPTEMGKKIIEQAKVVVNEFKRIEEVIIESKNLLEGEFRLGIIPTVSESLLPLFLKSFVKKFPKVKLKLSDFPTDDLVRRVINEDLDAGIAATPLNEPQLIERPLFIEPFFLLINPDHPLYKKPDIQEKDLIELDVLLMSEGHCFRNQVSQICKLQKNKGIFFESGNFQTLISLVEQNLGITFLPFLIANNLKLNRQKQMIRNISGLNPCRQISIIYRRRHLKEELINILEKSIHTSLPPALSELEGKKVQIINPKLI